MPVRGVRLSLGVPLSKTERCGRECDVAEPDWEAQSEAAQTRARALLRASRVVEAWESVGAQVSLVGSLATGLLMTHRDIDLHCYTRALDPSLGFQVMATIRPRRLEFLDLSMAADACLEWHAWVDDAEGASWQLDMIQLPEHSPWKGFFERRDERLRAVLTPETRRAILALKATLPEHPHIPGLEIYMAVLRDGVKSPEAFHAWRKTHRLEGIETWCP